MKDLVGATRFVVVLGLCVLLGSCGSGREPPPSDADLAELFRSRRTTFAALEEDGEAAPPDVIQRVVQRTDGLLLVAWSRDIVGPGGCAKGYALLREPPEDPVPSLDQHLCDRPGNVLAYRRLEGDWYLYFSASD